MKKIFFILICSIFLVGCSNTNNNNDDKIISEIEYFSTEIAQLLNDLNNIYLDNYELVTDKINIDKKTNNSSIAKETQNDSKSQENGDSKSESQSSDDKEESEILITSMKQNTLLNLDTEKIDWDEIKNKIELMSDSWDIVMLELYKSNVSNNDIMSFDNLLNQTIISIKNEDKATTLVNLGNMYYYIPKFLSSCSAQKHIQNIQTTKYNVLTAYICASQNDWSNIQIALSEAENSFLSVVNDTDYNKNKEFKVNKTYMQIKDLQNTVKYEDNHLFYVKYTNLIRNLNSI